MTDVTGHRSSGGIYFALILAAGSGVSREPAIELDSGSSRSSPFGFPPLRPRWEYEIFTAVAGLGYPFWTPLEFRLC